MASMNKLFIEETLGTTGRNQAGIARTFNRMNESLNRIGLDVFKNAADVLSNQEYMKTLVESVKPQLDNTANKYMVEDAERLNAVYGNVADQLMNEAVQNVGNLSPIMINSFGVQERALIGAHLPRAVKNVTAKIDNFKLTERIPFIVDLAGNKYKFVDAFIPDENGQSVNLSLSETVVMGFLMGDTDIDLYAGHGTSGDPDYRPAVSDVNVFGIDSIITDFAITATYGWKKSAEDPATAPVITFAQDSMRTINPEDGTFKAHITWSEWDAQDSYKEYTMSAIVSGQFDISNGKLVFVSTQNVKVTSCKFKMVLSPETHNNALTVGYDTKHTPVNIPIGEHLEYNLSEEFKDAAEKYYNVDAMALMTDYMGEALVQIKDEKTRAKFEELGENAILKTTFNCTPTTAFAQGKEEYIRREFAPFIEKVCILLKTKVRIPQCHFRVVGNPLDVRIAASAGTEYIYKRDQEFAGEIAIDYEFSVNSDVHKIFYLSSERIKAGKMYVFLIPNTIENNISTVNHYEYATYVSNKYRGTKSNLPTVMISSRYLTKEYYPVVGVITVLNNLVDDPTATTATGTGLADAIYARVKYVNA